MKENTDPKRNKSADEGRNNDPQLRDNTAIQPGASSISSGDSDANENPTKTGGKDPRTSDDGKEDRSFDDVDFD